MGFKSFEDLDVWKRASQLAVTIYKVLKESKEYGLKDQMQRAAVSIASNIAEGSERSPGDFIRFLRMARGSSAELRTQTYIANKIDMLNDEQRKQIVEETKAISRMLTGLAKAIQPNDKPTTKN